RRPVRRRQRIDGALQGALYRGLAGALAAVAALPGAPAVDLRVAVRDGGVRRLPERPLQVALPAAVVGRTERAGGVVERVQAHEQPELRRVEPRVEDGVREARVERVHDRDGGTLVVATRVDERPAVRAVRRPALE